MITITFPNRETEKLGSARLEAKVVTNPAT